MSIEVTPALEARLREIAERDGVTVEEYLAGVADRAGVRKPADEPAVEPAPPSLDDRREAEPEAEYDKVPVPTTPAGLLGYWEHVDALGVFEGKDGPTFARELRAKAENSRPSIAKLRKQARAGAAGSRSKVEPGH